MNIRIYLSISICLIFLAGCAIQKETQQLEINGKTVEYIMQGENSPTIIFETGMGQTIDTWNTVLDSLSKHTQVYAYNRPNYGQSEIKKPPKNVIDVAKQLRTNLVAQNISPPYILVGHSVGGLYINMFARLYPSEVAGVVFIDASHPKQFEYFRNNHSILYDLLILSTKKGNRKYEYDIVKTALSSFIDAPEFPNVPIAVLVAGKRSSPLESKKLREKWLSFQKDLASLSNESKHLIIKESGHYIHHNNPDIVISEILRIKTLTEEE
jgi:pimeloyl-ACP methyl ester carboxylesterase